MELEFRNKEKKIPNSYLLDYCPLNFDPGQPFPYPSYSTTTDLHFPAIFPLS